MIYKTISSPFNLLIAFFVVIFLYLLRLSNQITLPSIETVLYLTLCLGAMALGMSFGTKLKNLRSCKPIPFKPKLIPAAQRKLVLLLLTLSTLAFAFEHYIFFNKHGSIPIFNPDFEVLRMEFPVSGYVHILAMSGFIVGLSLYYDILIYKNSWTLTQKVVFYSLILINVLLAIMVGNRGTIALFFVQCFIIKFSFQKIRLAKLCYIMFLCLYALGASKLIRDYLYTGPSVIDDISKVWFMGGDFLFLPLYYGYVTFVMNFEILNHYITALDSYFYGYFSIVLPFDSLFTNNAYQLIELQKDVLKDDFYGLLTSTGFGVPYFDFGYFGFIVIFLLSFLLGYSFYVVYSCGKIYYVPFYSYLMTAFLTLIYTYSFNELYIWIYLFLLFLISRLYKERIP